MQTFKVEFDRLQWQSPLPGARFKCHRDSGKQLRMLELTREFVEPDWCEKGHIGLVLEGALEEGDGLFIPPGPEGGHKARSLTAVARPVLVEDF